MSFRSRPKCKKRSSEVYRSLSVENPKRRQSSKGSINSDDLHLSWRQRFWFNMRSCCCCGKPRT